MGRADGRACGAKKRFSGTLSGASVPNDRVPNRRFARRWSERTEIGAERCVERLGVGASKFYDWREGYGKANEHNA